MSGISFGGLASGLDTNSIITSLMQIEARPKTLLENRKATLTTAQVAFNELRKLVTSLNSSLTSIGNLVDWSVVKVTSSNKDHVVARTSGSGTPQSIQLSVTQLASNHTVATAGQTDLDTTSIATGLITISTNAGSTTVDVAGGTLQEVVAAINGQTDVAVRAAAVQVSPGQYKLHLTATNGGETVTTDVAQFGPIGGGWTTVSNSQQAIVHVGDPLAGYDLTSTSNTITDIIPGVTVDLLQAGGGAVTIETKPDNDKIADKIQAVVDAYNKVAEEIKAKTAYDTETKKAEALFGQSSVRTARQVLADAIVGDVNTNASNAGIQTTKTGGLTFDRSKFIAALESDPAATQALFIEDDPLAPGLVTRLKAAVSTANDIAGGLLKSGQDAVTNQINGLDEQIKSWERRLVTREATLRRQFTNLETLMAQLQARGNAFAGMFGSSSS